jgi:hypothetical protein
MKAFSVSSMFSGKSFMRFLGALSLAVLPFSASASPLLVNNFSFETVNAPGLTNACGTGCSYSVGNVAGWTSSGLTGQFVPGTQVGNFALLNTLSDGPTSAWVNGDTSGPGMLFQTLGSTVQLGYIYTLLVDIGWRNDTANLGVARLLINGTVYSGSFVGSPSQGNWTTEMITYVGTAADVGSAITIQLRSTGAQGNFDNVRLDATAPGTVPEPALSGAIALALIGLAVGRRKRA